MARELELGFLVALSFSVEVGNFIVSCVIDVL